MIADFPETMTVEFSIPKAFLIAKAALVSKSAMMAGLAAGIASFLATESFTRNIGISALFSAISIPAAAYFASRPKVIAAQAAAEASRRTLADSETTALLKRMTDLHEAELSLMRNERDKVEQELALVRYSKHKVIEALNSAEIRIRNYEVYMRDHNLDYHEKFGAAYETADRAEIFAEENRQLLRRGTADITQPKKETGK